MLIVPASKVAVPVDVILTAVKTAPKETEPAPVPTIVVVILST